MAVSPCSIIEHFDVFEDVCLGKIACSVDLSSDTLLFRPLKNDSAIAAPASALTIDFEEFAHGQIIRDSQGVEIRTTNLGGGPS